MTTIIHISKEEVYDKAMRLADYTGSKVPEEQSQNGDVYDRIAITDHDKELLDGYWDSGVTIMQEHLKNHLGPESSASAYYEQVVNLSKGFDTAKTSSVAQNMRDFMTNYVLGQWFTVTNKEGSTDLFATAVENLKSADRILYSRMKPQLPSKKS
ncbi:MAG: hypothetical protein HDR97_00385 [Bacteroides sp.]|nr:hypothetical protein [Bacteroides sp.]